MNRYNFVIPYRNRPNSLKIFQEKFPVFLRTQDYIDEFNILVVEQEEGKPFNLAKNINVGFDMIKKKFSPAPEDRFIFHPVDCLPITGSFEIPHDGAAIFCDGSRETRARDHGFWGKAHGFRTSVMEKINGYSNEYWGWGCEDNDLFIRLDIAKVPLILIFFQYELLMGHGDDHTPDVDVSDVQTVNYLKNKLLLNKMTESRDPWQSGLNTLEYKMLQEFDVDPENNIRHVLVSL